MEQGLVPKAKAVAKRLEEAVKKTTGLQEATDFISSNWTMGNLTLLPEVAREYIEDIIDRTGFLSKCRRIETKKLSLNMNIYQIQERKSYRPTVLTASTTAQRAVVSNVGLEATLKRMATIAYIDYDAIEDNQDKGADFVVRLTEDMLIKQRANDEADLAMNGTTDTWVADTFLTNNKGFPQLAKDNSSVYKVTTSSSGSLSTKIGILEAMWDELPEKRKTAPGLTYVLNINDLMDYRREIGAKEGMGYVFVTGNAEMSEGIPIIFADYQPEGFYFLGRLEDFGVIHNLNMIMSMENKPELSCIKAILNQSIDFQFVNPENLCVGYSFTPPDVTITPDGTTFASTQSVALTTDTDNEDNNVTIYYTTNGSTPDTTDGTLYSAAFTLSDSAVVKARTYKNGVAGTIATATFTTS